MTQTETFTVDFGAMYVPNVCHFSSVPVMCRWTAAILNYAGEAGKAGDVYDGGALCVRGV